MNKVTLNIFNKSISIFMNNDDVFRDIENTFKLFLAKEEVKLAEIEIKVVENKMGDYDIFFNEKKSACAKINLYPKLCEIIRRSLIFCTDLFCFHAAAVERKGKSYIFVSTGNSGKSTLCTSLVFGEYNLITDDTCWMDVVNDVVKPYPLAIGTREKTIELLPSLSTMVRDTSFPGKKIIPVSNEFAASETKPYVFFLWELDFSTNDFRIKEISKIEMTLSLLSHSFSFKYCDNKKELYDSLLKMMQGCKCYRISGHNLSALPTLLESI